MSFRKQQPMIVRISILYEKVDFFWHNKHNLNLKRKKGYLRHVECFIHLQVLILREAFLFSERSYLKSNSDISVELSMNDHTWVLF